MNDLLETLKRWWSGVPSPITFEDRVARLKDQADDAEKRAALTEEAVEARKRLMVAEQRIRVAKQSVAAPRRFTNTQLIVFGIIALGLILILFNAVKC